MSTTRATPRIPIDAIEELVAQRYVSVQKHPTADLYIYNYTPKAAWEKRWTPETRMCRGLILDGAGNVVQRPFEKFFNWGDPAAGPIPLDEPFEVYEKVDGSLGILHWAEAEPALATRGSFTSTQAVQGTRILREQYGHTWAGLERRLTYLFEIIYPLNRIVVDYGRREDIVLLAVIETATGRDLSLGGFESLGFPVVERHDGVTDFRELAEVQASNREGYVVKFASGLRLKIKLEEYVRLHRLVTGVTHRRIWEALRMGIPLATLKDTASADYRQWVDDVAAEIQGRYRAIEDEARRDFKDLGDRKANALYYATCRHPAVLFRMLDGRPYDDVIWRLVRPEQSSPFKVEV
ncbi:MAG: 2'-5' RNA ligase [Chloroflexi bacterium]|nr:2'-5' RNA ligase [Chloroflexota bacterium]